MIKLFDAQQTKAWDAQTIQQEGIASIELMERACKAFTIWFTEQFNATLKIGVICGTGNNGGDGLGIARLLNDWGYRVKVWVIQGSSAASDDFKINLERLKQTTTEIDFLTSAIDKGLWHDRDILIDAVFGSGLSRPPEGIYAQAIRSMNETEALRIAVDIPSGLLADKPSADPIVNAHYTISFQQPKLAFLLPQYQHYVGQWKVVDIGLSKTFQKNESSPYFFTAGKAIKKLLKPRSKFDHKGTFGHVLLMAGSFGKIGAAVLAAKAALRTGAGLVTVCTPRCGYVVMQSAVPEAMVIADADEHVITAVPPLENISTIGIGPGLGQHKDTVKVLRNTLEKFGKPMVIDADGLNILAAHRELVHLLPEGSILTPHPKEFERLVGAWKNDFERLEKQKQLATLIKGIVVLKGAYTAVATPSGKVYFNSTGNPGMATGGTGDVLTGILSSLMAQKYSAEDAAVLGVYIHGLAGDMGIIEKSQQGLIASDIPEYLSAAFLHLSR